MKEVLTSIDQPVWLEIIGKPLHVAEFRLWPLLPPKDLDFSTIEKLAQEFLSQPTKLFSGKTSDPKGSLYLQYQTSINGYHGIWIPTSFPSLNQLVKPILEYWHSDTSDLEQWILQFFALRLNSNYLEYFQSENSYSINIPPTFVLTIQQINGNLLHKLRNNVDTILELELDNLYEILEKELPDQYRSLLDKIYGENELTLIHLMQAYLKTYEMITQEEYQHLKSLIDQLSPHLGDYLLTSYLIHRVSQDKDIGIELISHIRNRVQSDQGMLKVLGFRLLASYYQQIGDLTNQEYYYEQLLLVAPSQSWNSRLDLINSQLGLARCSTTRGDYFRAMTFYSFARQGFMLLDNKSISEQMEVEYQRISLLSANQQLQTGLYFINHNDYGKNAFLILIDGIQAAFTHFIRYHDSFLEIEQILPPVLRSATSTLRLNQDKIADMFERSIDYDGLVEVADLLTIPDNRGLLLQRMQKQAEDLSFKDQKMIETISVFYHDGRHIGDYYLSNNNFKQETQSVNQSLFSSAMSAVNMLITEATQSDSTVDEISVGNKRVIYEMGEYLSFCLIAKSSSSNLKKILRSVVNSAESEFQPILKDWNGNLAVFDNLPEFLTPLSFYTIDKEELNLSTDDTEF